MTAPVIPPELIKIWSKMKAELDDYATKTGKWGEVDGRRMGIARGIARNLAKLNEVGTAAIQKNS